MSTVFDEGQLQTIDIVKEIEINAPIAIAFEALLDELGPAGEMMDGKPFPMVLEARPGGRWYRDLGNDAGHLWGHVQVIKPPALLEICGPMFMSFAGINHLQYRLTAEGNRTRLKLTHTAVGHGIPEEVQTGVHAGWQYRQERIRNNAERRAKGDN